MTNDVEKRYDRPPAFRAAALYVGAVVAVAAVAFAVYAFAARDSVIAASLVPATLFVGLAGCRLVPAGLDVGMPVDSRRRYPGGLGRCG